MKKYQYKICKILVNDSEQIEKDFQYLGNRGWKLVSIDKEMHDGHPTDISKAYFIRELDETENY